MGDNDGESSDTRPSIDWSSAFQSKEFCAGIADVVAQALAKRQSAASTADQVSTLASLGDAVPGSRAQKEGVARRPHVSADEGTLSAPVLWASWAKRQD